MEPHPYPGILFAERLDGGVVITFEDGKTAIYSATLLRSLLTQAQELFDDPEDIERSLD